MSPIPASSPHTLPEALCELSMAQEVPDARLLDEVVRRYPEFGNELTEFAVALALDAQRERHTPDAHPDHSDRDPLHPNPALSSPAVRRSLQHFQNRLRQLEGKPARQPHTAGAAIANADPPNPFSRLDRSGFRALAERLDANTVFVCKLRDRQIEPDTIPLHFQRRIAQELVIPLSTLQAHFAASPSMRGGQYFKSDGKPKIGERQSFEDAVKNSDLSPAQQRALLKKA